MKRKFFLMMLAMQLGVAAALASGLALIYDSEEAVEEGRSWPAMMTNVGAAVPADKALESATTLIYGDGAGLFHGSIVRLDNDLNVALIRKGDSLDNETLAQMHQVRWDASLSFLNMSEDAATGEIVVEPAIKKSDMPFVVKINGKEAGAAPIMLNERFKKARFRMEVVNTSTTPVWNVEVNLTAKPDLSFHKEGRSVGLNDVPTKEFKHTYQSVFKPLKTGDKYSIPMEVFFIYEQDYVWTFEVKSKSASCTINAKVRFH